jgi:Chaperone of endosialidase
MGLETATFINGLVDTNPTSSDNANQGDNHLRLIKSTLKATFPNITGAVTVSHTEINSVTSRLALTGGTLTGALNGTSAAFSGTVSATGGFTGNVTGNLTGNVTGGTANVPESGTNLYYTDARARAAISAAGDLSYNPTTGVISFSAAAAPVTSVAGRTGAVVLTSTDVSEGTRLYFTDARARSAISVTGNGSYNSATGVITINASAAPVTSVAGKTGAVTLAISDISGLQSALDGKFSASGGTLGGSLSVSGSITATGDITAFSDIRTKMNVETISEAIYKVKQLRGVSYISKFNMEPRIGVIAQEVERVVPEVVHTHSEGLKSVAYQNLVGLLIEAIKDLEARVAELENR